MTSQVDRAQLGRSGTGRARHAPPNSLNPSGNAALMPDLPENLPMRLPPFDHARRNVLLHSQVGRAQPRRLGCRLLGNPTFSNHPPAEPGAFVYEPLKAANRGR